MGGAGRLALRGEQHCSMSPRVAVMNGRDMEGRPRMAPAFLRPGPGRARVDCGERRMSAAPAGGDPGQQVVSWAHRPVAPGGAAGWAGQNTAPATRSSLRPSIGRPKNRKGTNDDGVHAAADPRAGKMEAYRAARPVYMARRGRKPINNSRRIGTVPCEPREAARREGSRGDGAPWRPSARRSEKNNLSSFQERTDGELAAERSQRRSRAVPAGLCEAVLHRVA